jgi:hypothetical protein
MNETLHDKNGVIECCGCRELFSIIHAAGCRARQSDRSNSLVDDTSTTTGALDQTDEDILTCTVSDEALESAAGTGPGITVLLCESHIHVCKPP